MAITKPASSAITIALVTFNRHLAFETPLRRSRPSADKRPISPMMCRKTTREGLQHVPMAPLRRLPPSS